MTGGKGFLNSFFCVLAGYFGQMYALGMQNGSDPRFLQGIATLKHFDANSLEGDWPGPPATCGASGTSRTCAAAFEKLKMILSHTPPCRTAMIGRTHRNKEQVSIRQQKHEKGKKKLL